MTARVAAVLLLAAATGCHPKARGPGFEPVKTVKVVVRGESLQLVRTIEDRAEVDAFMGCLARAERGPSKRIAHTHSIDVHGPHGGRWLLDAANGELELLTMQAGKPVYRLRAADLETVRRLLAPDGGG